MARQIVTQEAVSEVAQGLIREGQEPSIIAVQSRIGGGSYSTVKRYLDAWKLAQTEAANSATPLPAEVRAKGEEFTRAVWALAAGEAQREARQAKEEANAAVAALTGELSEAQAEIARLEGVETELATTVEQQQAQLREGELALVEAQAQARRVPDLEKALAESRTEVDAARQTATDKAVEAGKLAGEAEALRAQVRELMGAIKAA